MIRNRILLKSLAVFFVIEILVSAILPSYSWALTAGPTAPEATSFEPVDTTDMVNISSGDFTYNLPLLEVPGPAGSYPVSLSYHAGIDPEEEASWVGLGWTLNPGSVSRLVNGYPDDLNGPDFIDRLYWEGGETTTYTVGVSVGIANCATVSAGLSFAEDTYKGFGMGAYVGVGLGYQLTDAIGVGINATVGISPYGGAYASAGIGIGISTSVGQANRASASLGLSVNSSGDVGAGVSGGISAYSEGHSKPISVSGVGASISSGGSKPSFSAAGISAGVYNSKQNNISTDAENFSVDIPVWYGVNVRLGRSYVRYWMDESDETKTFGSLYFPQTYTPTDYDYFDDKAYDAYHIFDDVNSLVSETDPEKVLGGTFADYDHYSVNAQGIGGVMRPHHYRLTIFRQNKRQNNDPWEVKTYSTPQHYNGGNGKIDFRFVNDFSNKLEYNPPLIDVAQDPTPLSFILGTPTTGPDNSNTLPHVPGSKYVEYFTNEEILNTSYPVKERGFVECQALGFQRTDALNKGTIGGFTMTNTSGVSYHFSLPAYTYDEYSYSANKNFTDGRTFNTLSQPVKYAYTWYLTAITGPDYVDRNHDGFVNDGDWGYWVSFDYGKWTDSYRWRNPGLGFNRDLDNRFNNFSKGRKEIYYLNSIRTASHTVFFVKEMRWDGKSANPQYDLAVVADENNLYWVDEGNFEKKTYEVIESSNSYYYDSYPASLLKLKSAYIFSNKDIAWTNLPARSTGYTYENLGQDDIPIFEVLGQNVLDVTDIQDILQDFNAKSIRSVDFETDYSLSPGVSNSYISDVDATLASVTQNATLLGKLTLKALDFRGKGAASVLPKLRFQYELEGSTIYNVLPTAVSEKDLTISTVPYANELATYEKGDIVYFEQTATVPNDSKFYGYVSSKSGSTLTIHCINGDPLNKPLLLLKKTKNPPYAKDMADIWASYKVDQNGNPFPNIGHLTSDISGKNADVWSLRKINTQLGSVVKIEYESDTYSKSVYNRSHSLIINTVDSFEDVTTPAVPGTTFRVTARFTTGGLDLRDLFAENTTIDLLLLYKVCLVQGSPPPPDPCLTQIGTTAKVIQVGSSFLRLQLNHGYVPTQPILENQYTFYNGNVFLGSNVLNYGGGIRVKSISLNEELRGQGRQTAYEYEFNGVSSGVTSYVPVIMDRVFLPLASDEDIRIFKTFLYKDFEDLLTLGRSIPSPAVMYGKVRMRERIMKNSQILELPEYSEYEFETYNKGMLGRIVDDERYYSFSGVDQSLNYNKIAVKRTAIKDYTQRLGNLKKITLYAGDGQKLSETVNHYLHDNLPDQDLTTNINVYQPRLDQYLDQGVMQETFNHGRFVKDIGTNYKILGVISKKESYPSIQLGSTVTNYKTGIKTVSKNLGFDFFTGEVLKTLNSDGYGNHFVAETIPAYTVYDKMGRKNDTNSFPYGPLKKHMLVQPAANYVYKVDGPATLNKIAIVSATAKLWSDGVPVLNATYADQLTGNPPYQIGIWRAGSEYTWVGDKNKPRAASGLQPFSEFVPFNFASPTQHPSWEKNTDINLYDVYSHGLEAKDINGNFAATKMSYDQLQIFATASNSRYDELAYSGAEESPGLDGAYGGGVFRQDGQEVFRSSDADATTTHTGGKALRATFPSQKVFHYTFPSQVGRTYHASVWVNTQYGRLYYSIDNVPTSTPVLPVASKKAGAWYLLDMTIPASSSATTIRVWGATAPGGFCNFDDFRVCPIESVMVSYVYNQWGELSDVLDNNNLYTHYNYDDMGRLKEVRRETFKHQVVKVNENSYHYTGQN